ncbi:hypothetical protein Tco_0142176, partial [Tanacetum coccineum]
AAVCTIVGITFEEEDALEWFSGIRIPKNGSLFMCDGVSWSTIVEEGESVDAAGSGATTSVIGAMTSGATLCYLKLKTLRLNLKIIPNVSLYLIVNLKCWLLVDIL